MMIKPDDQDLKIFDRLLPWLIPGEKEGDGPSLDQTAPDDIKNLYKKRYGKPSE